MNFASKLRQFRSSNLRSDWPQNRRLKCEIREWSRQDLLELNWSWADVILWIEFRIQNRRSASPMTKKIGCLIFEHFGQLSQVKSHCDPLKRMSTSNTELYVHHRRSASPETKTIGFWIFEEFGQMLPVTIVDKSLKGPWKDSKMKMINFFGFLCLWSEKI